jgi:hypothetical protein
MNHSKPNLELQIKYDILELLLDECYFSKDYYAIGLLISNIVEVMPLHLSQLIKVSNLICNINNNKSIIKLLAQKSLPTKKSAQITEYRNIEISKELLTLFVELFISNDLIDDCQLYLRSQMSNPTVSSSDVYVYYLTMIKLLKIIPHSNLKNIIKNPIEIFKSFKEKNSNLNISFNESNPMDIQEEANSSSDSDDDDDDSDNEINKRKKARSSTPNRDVNRSGIHSSDGDDIHIALEKLATKNHDSIILNTFYIASLYSKNELRKALKYLNDVKSEDNEDVKNQFSKLLLQYYALIIIEEGDPLNELKDQILQLMNSYFSKGQNYMNAEPHCIYCCILLHKLDVFSSQRLVSVINDAIETLPSLYSVDITPAGHLYSRHLWRTLANTLGPLSKVNTVAFDKNLESSSSSSSISKAYLDQYMYWNSTVLSGDDECDPYPTVFEIRFLNDYLNSQKDVNMIERMRCSYDFLNSNLTDDKSYFDELMLIISGINLASNPFLTFKGIDANDYHLDFSVIKKSFPAFSSDLWGQEKKHEKYPFFCLSDGYLEILSFQIVVSCWINQLTESSFALKGIQTMVQHAYLENIEKRYGPAHYCLKYLKDMNIDIMKCVQKAFDRAIQSQDSSNGVLLSILTKPLNSSSSSSDIESNYNNNSNNIPNFPQFKSYGEFYIPK